MRLRVPGNACPRTIPQLGAQVGYGALLLAVSILANSQASSPTEHESWTASSETASSTMAPSRQLETHVKNENHILDTRTVQVRGPDGSYENYSDTESELIQDNASRSRFIVRRYAPGPGGERQLIQLTEETRAAEESGGSMVRTTSEPDSLGNLQAVQRETKETKRAAGTVKSKWVTFTKDPAGAFVPSQQTEEVQNVLGNGELRLTSKTSVPDVSGAWQVIEQRERITRKHADGQRVEETTWCPDFEGQMSRVGRVLTQDSIVNGRKVETVETYSIDAAGTARDGILRLINRSTTTHEERPEKAGSEETIEQPVPGGGISGDLKTMTTVSRAVVPKQSGTEETTTTRVRNLDGSFTVISEETRQSQQIPMQIQMSPADRPK
jgi:hypothetical protein